MSTGPATSTSRPGSYLDIDQVVSDEIRFVQLTPPGSACSIAIGKGMTKMEPGSLDSLQMVVPDAEAARAELLGRGVEVSEVDVMPWGSFVFFTDPDGNSWALQQLPDWSKGPRRIRRSKRRLDRLSRADLELSAGASRTPADPDDDRQDADPTTMPSPI